MHPTPSGRYAGGRNCTVPAGQPAASGQAGNTLAPPNSLRARGCAPPRSLGDPMQRSRRLVAAVVGACAMAPVAAVSTSAAVSPGDWPMGGDDASGSGVNPQETVLGPSTVGRLKTQWKFTTPGAVYGTPAVVGGRVYDADSTGMVYSLDAATGTPVWVTNLGPATFAFFVTSSPLVTDSMVIVGDQSGVVHALDRQTGLPLWATRPNSYGLAAIYGPPSIATVSTPLGPRTLILVPVASNDETATQPPEQ